MLKDLLRLLLGTFSIVQGEGGPDPKEGDDGEDGGEATDDADEDAGGADEQEGDGADADGGGDSRAVNIKALRQRAQTEARGRADAEARLAALEQQNRELLNRVGTGARQAEEELPADADETQKFVFKGNKAIGAMQQRVAKAEMTAWNAADKVEFYARTQRNPTMLKYADRVEKELERMVKAEGNPAPRSAIYRYIRGQEAEEAEVKAAAKPNVAAKEAAKRVKDARGTPSNVRSDASGKERMDEREARRKRLEKETL